MIDILLLSAGVIGLIIGTITDFQKREVPDWLNYALISIGLGLRLIHLIIYKEINFFLYGIIGFVVFFGLGYLMYYTGQWGGGDTKMMMGLGAIFATYPVFLRNYLTPYLNIPFLAIFVMNVALAGAFYGLLYSVFLGIKHRAKFAAEFKKSTKKFQKLRMASFVVFIVLFILTFLSPNLYYFFFLVVVALAILTSYIWVFSKVVEKVCMLKKVSPEALTEGEWIAEDIVIDGVRITGPKDLGISNENIKKLIQFKKEKKIDLILIKQGIPFVPSFLIGMIISLIWGNWVFFIIR